MRKAFIIAGLIIYMLSTANQAQELYQKTVRLPQKGSLITGSCLVGMPVALCIFASAMSGYGFESIIPIAGPLLLMGNESPSTEGTVVYLGLSIAEAIGTALIIRGAIGKEHLVSVTPYYYRKGAGCTLAYNIIRRD